MKLLTHNMLASNVKNITNRYPLAIQVEQVEEEENEYNDEFIKRMLPRIDYEALRAAACQVGLFRVTGGDQRVDLDGW